MESMQQEGSQMQQQSNSQNLSDAERWASLIGGGAMVLMGLQQRSLRGALMALAGGGLAYHGATSQQSIKDTVSNKVGEAMGGNQSLRVEKSVTIAKPADELYRFWRNFENLPRFMKHLKSVTVYDDRRSHWIANAPMGNSVEWDAEMVQDQENHLIAWTSVADADVDNSGFVRFQPAPGDRGTEVKVVIEYNPPGGAIGNAIAKLFGESPEQQVGDDLRRFKMLMEAGEIATTEGQPSCRG